MAALDSLLGNETLKESLSAALAAGRLSHSILLCGEAGTGAGFAARPFATVRTIVDAAVLDGHPTVGQQFVVRLHTRQPPFERMIVAGDLIPGAHVARQVERRHRSAVGTVGGTAVYHADDKQRSGQ